MICCSPRDETEVLIGSGEHRENRRSEGILPVFLADMTCG